MSAGVALTLTPQEKASFVAGRHAARVLTETTLYRLLGRNVKNQWNSVYGQKCWFDEPTFFDCICDARDDGGDRAAAISSLRFLLRDRLAVAADWNDFQSFAALRIPPGAAIECETGPAAAQPFIVDGHGPGRQLGPLILSGGAMQYILNVTRDLTPWIKTQELRSGRA